MSNHPVILYGSSDSLGSFHLAGVAVTSNERKEDFAALMASVDGKILELYNINRRETVKVAVADDAVAIHNAYREHFSEDVITANCAVHLVCKLILPLFAYMLS